MSRRTLVSLTAISILLVLAIGTLFWHSSRVNWLGDYTSPAPLKLYASAAVSSDAEGCANVGRDLMLKNGTAMDAAIGTLLCMGVVIPQSLGIGGGLFITFYNRSSGESTVYDGREVAPLAAKPDMFAGNASLAMRGPLSIAIPGEIAAYWAGHQAHGRLPWSDLFAATVDIAENGFNASWHLEQAIRRYDEVLRQSDLKRAFFKDNGEQINKNDFVRRRELAQTLRLVAQYGADMFYNGSMMRKMVTELRAKGSIITEEDFRTYAVKIYPALRVDMEARNLTMFGVRPPGSGALLGFILNVMSGYDDLYPEAKNSEDGAALFFHRLIETFKYAYASRMQLGDEDFDDVQEVFGNLISSEYAAKIREKISDDHTYAQDHYGTIRAIRDDHGTAHCSVIDQFGNAVSATSSVNLYFGSMVATSNGVIFNDQMDDFSSSGVTNFFGLPPSKFNKISPKKRPLSSMCPSVIVDSNSGEVKLAIGGAGGTKITSGTAIVAIRNLFFKENIKQATDAARVHNQLFPDEVVYDERFPPELLEILEKKGHKIKKQSGRNSVIIGLSRADDSNQIEATFDYKKSGSIDGF